MNIAFVITDESNKIAILSGKNDAEHDWYLTNDNVNENVFNFRNCNMHCIDVDVLPNNEYIYNLDIKPNLYIQIKTLDLETELSEKCCLAEFVDNLIGTGLCSKIDTQGNNKQIKIDILGTVFDIRVNTLVMPRGTKDKLSIHTLV